MTERQRGLPDATTNQAFFEIVDGAFEPRPHARSPWSESMVHGKHLAGLAARSAEIAFDDADYQPSRLTIDLFRSAPMAALAVRASIRRQGGRVCVVEVSITGGSGEVAWASVQFMRRSIDAPGEFWCEPGWQALPPGDLPGRVPPNPRMGDARWVSEDRFRGATPKQLWFRECLDLVDGEKPSLFTRAAWAADIASPIANSGSLGLGYINSDINLHLSRLPVTDWIGFSSHGRCADAGVSVGECALYDEAGRIGYVVTGALKQDGSAVSAAVRRAAEAHVAQETR